MQIQNRLHAAGFPLIKHLGTYDIKDKRYSGGLFELHGQVFRPLRRNFAEVRDAIQTVPPQLIAPLPLSRSRSLNPLNEDSQVSFKGNESKAVLNFVCCIIQPMLGRKTPDQVRLGPLRIYFEQLLLSFLEECRAVNECAG